MNRDVRRTPETTGDGGLNIGSCVMRLNGIILDMEVSV